MKLRSVLLWLHRWVGVLAGVVILVIAVTGAAIVIEKPLNRWLAPEFYPRQAVGSKRAPIELARDTLRSKHPEVRLQGIVLPRGQRDALKLFAGNRVMHVDPGTGELLGWRPRRDGLTQTLIKLHVNLMAGPKGGTVVVVATMLTLGLALTGLWLWWPLKIVWFKRKPNFRRFNLDLHSVAGLYSSVFLLVIAVTGLTLRYLHLEHPEAPASNPQWSMMPQLDADEAVRLAEATLPGARAVSLELPGPSPRATMRVQLAFPEDGSAAGRSVVFLDQFTGNPLSVHSARQGTWRERYGNLQLSLHTGTIGGLATEALAFLACAALVLQILSGYVLWWKRKETPATQPSTA